MNMNVSIDGSKALIVLEGKLTVQTSPDLNAAVDRLPAGVCDIDIDVAKVGYVASAGLRMLVSADKLAVARGGTMRLLHPVDEVVDVLEMTGLSESFVVVR